MQILATHGYQHGKLEDALEFLKRTRSELRSLRKVQVAREWVHVLDINGDCFELTGIGYPDADVVPILQAVNTAFRPESIHDDVPEPFKEFKTGRRYAWAQDRVM